MVMVILFFLARLSSLFGVVVTVAMCCCVHVGEGVGVAIAIVCVLEPAALHTSISSGCMCTTNAPQCLI